MGFPRQDYWSGLPFPSRDLLHPGTVPTSPALQADSSPTEPPGKPPDLFFCILIIKKITKGSTLPGCLHHQMLSCSCTLLPHYHLFQKWFKPTSFTYSIIFSTLFSVSLKLLAKGTHDPFSSAHEDFLNNSAHSALDSYNSFCILFLAHVLTLRLFKKCFRYIYWSVITKNLFLQRACR